MKKEIHIMPSSDSDGEHKARRDCRCRPQEKDAGILTHNITGTGPDHWRVRVVAPEIAAQLDALAALAGEGGAQ